MGEMEMILIIGGFLFNSLTFIISITRLRVGIENRITTLEVKTETFSTQLNSHDVWERTHRGK